MKKQISKYILILLIIICIIMLGILVYMKFFSSLESKEYAKIKEKAEGEIIYLDSSIIELLNKLNNISYSRYDVTIKQINENKSQSNSENKEAQSKEENGNQESGSNSQNNSEITNESESRISKLSQSDSLLNSDYNSIPWEEISFGVETIFTAWPTINIDMKTLNVKDDDITNFTITLDGAAQAIKAKDKNNALINLYNLYVLLPKFLSYFENDEEKLNLYYTKAYVLNAYVSADKESWSEMDANINQAIKSMNTVINTTNIDKKNFDKSYTLLNELKRGISLQDKEIFYLKYKLAMEELEIL